MIDRRARTSLNRWLAGAAFAVGAAGCGRRAEPAIAPVPAPHAAPVVTVTPAHTPADTVRSGTLLQEFRGAYSSGFEISWFEPCGTPPDDRLWWVTLTENARLQRDSLLKLLPVKPTAGLAVTWRATISPKMPGGAGQMGRGTRYMLVSEILGLQALSSVGACGTRTTMRPRPGTVAAS